MNRPLTVSKTKQNEKKRKIRIVNLGFFREYFVF